MDALLSNATGAAAAGAALFAGVASAASPASFSLPSWWWPATLTTPPPAGAAFSLRDHAAFLATPHAAAAAATLVWPWLVHVVLSWIGFAIYIRRDRAHFEAGSLARVKLRTRHPVDVAPPTDDPTDLRVCGVRVASPFVYAQACMVPLVLFNQFVVWPLTSLLVVWPQWAARHRPLAEWGGAELAATALVLFLVSDQMWYASHRAMHTPYAWRHWHRMHHVAPQCAISATYVHPVEYALWAIAMQLPWAVAGFPLGPFLVPLGWGMLTGGGAHSGYGDPFANGAKHNAHHYYHNVNFSLLMLADMAWGTHWTPGEPPPRHSTLADDVARGFPAVFEGGGDGAHEGTGSGGGVSGGGGGAAGGKRKAA